MSPSWRQTCALGIAVSAALALSACSSGSGGGTPVGPDTTAPAVSASPGTSTFTGASVDVTLSVSDNVDPAPVIYYTTDATYPTNMSSVYAGPITVSATTVLRYFAEDADGNASDVQYQAYTQTLNPFEVDWATSGHGNVAGEPFRHWDEDGSVSTSCARCHSGGGFVDYAEDGTTDVAAALPLGHYCDTCHSTAPATLFDDLMTHPALAAIPFPSAAEVSLWDNSNMCIVCHQGRSSSVQVDSKIAGDPGGPYTFTNIHYYPAAASYFGDETRGGYEFAGEEYAGRNIFPSHPGGKQTCVGCHMRLDDSVIADHTWEPQLSDCTSCHAGTSFETLAGSPSKNHAAIESAKTDLLDVIYDYAATTIGVGIVYDGGGYPYFFKDLNLNGEAEADELTYGNRYDQFDEELLKAAYNYQMGAKEPNAYIHNGTYVRQLLHDSIVALGGTPTDIAPGRPGFDNATANKSEQWHLSGHADSGGEPFRHWDEDGEVSASCAKCHSGSGFADFAVDGMVDAPAPLGDLVSCGTCHNSDNLFVDDSTRWDDLGTNTALAAVEFPSGDTADLGNASNICMSCHQGRESGDSVATATPNGTVQTPTDYPSYNFINRHYYAAGAIFFGADVTAAFEYPAHTYKTMNQFTGHNPVDDIADCIGCHMRGETDHNFVPQIDDCIGCHQGITDFTQLGLPFGNVNTDYDGDMTPESFQGEIDGMAANLYLAIQAYAVNDLPQPSPVVYSGHAYPYWFKDSNGDGLVTPGEDTYGNRYNDFDLTMLKAAFNYHSAQDPASDIHNYQYVLQTLYDSLDDLDDGVFNNSPLGIRP